ncbi:hypothetical protein [Companilactobacillus metriopterae]|uniref:hypothetical protein n=1 Tax=Companilactobacillus metriopterae TaxID=1909267 RepID=UPI00100B143F|nr:hypothetical protein [Companilactobacillus metriopterae]
MHKKIFISVFSLLILGLFIIFPAHSNSNQVLAADTTVTPHEKPTSDPTIFLFIWLTTGYSLQPQSQYTYVGHPKTLMTSASLSIWDAILHPLASQHYTWYTSSNNGSTWTDMKKGDQDITVAPTQVGETHYQQKVRWYSLFPGLFDPTAYSKVATVTTLPDPVNAKSLKVNADERYLYNNQKDSVSTYVHATPFPTNATGEVTWAVNDTSLATINNKTGLLTANNQSKSGVVTVTGTITNNDGSTVSDSTTVEIGGGLEDQTVDEGNTATFAIKGNFSATPDSIAWHKVVNGNDTVVSTLNSRTYTTPKTTYKDDGTKYYAVIKISQDGQSTTITTNQAKLNVNFDTEPRITLDSTIEDKTYTAPNNDNTTINSVAKNDNIVIKGNIKDDNVNSKLASGLLTFKIPSDLNVADVKIDGSSTSNYLVTNDSDPSTKYLNIFDLSFKTTKTHSFELSGYVGSIQLDNYQSFVSFKGVDNNDDELDGEYRSNILNINYTTNNITANSSDIDYGSIGYKNINQPVSAQLSNSNRIALEVEDKRREKKPKQIYLSEDKPLTNSTGNKMNADLRYYYSNGNFDSLSKGSLLILSTKLGEAINSIYWSDKTGLNLYLYNLNTPKGDYEASLTWTIVDSVK